MKRLVSLLGLVAALSAVPASAYYHFVYYLSSGNAPAKFDLTALPDKTVWFFVSETGGRGGFRTLSARSASTSGGVYGQ